MNRRSFLHAAGLSAVGLGLLSTPLGALAQYSRSPGMQASPNNTVILELANFNCSRCRAVNDQYQRMHQAAREHGYDMRFAPVVWEQQPLWPDRVYYAFRDLYPEAESLARNALFDGIHREGMRFENLEQVLAYFERRQVPQAALSVYPNFNAAQLAERANSEDVLFSEIKASRLIEQSGAEEVPVFMWVRDGEVIHAITPAEANGDARALVQLVLRTIINPTP